MNVVLGSHDAVLIAYMTIIDNMVNKYETQHEGHGKLSSAAGHVYVGQSVSVLANVFVWYGFIAFLYNKCVSETRQVL